MVSPAERRVDRRRIKVHVLSRTIKLQGTTLRVSLIKTVVPRNINSYVVHTRVRLQVPNGSDANKLLVDKIAKHLIERDMAKRSSTSGPGPQV